MIFRFCLSAAFSLSLCVCECVCVCSLIRFSDNSYFIHELFDENMAMIFFNSHSCFNIIRIILDTHTREMSARNNKYTRTFMANVKR